MDGVLIDSEDLRKYLRRGSHRWKWRRPTVGVKEDALSGASAAKKVPCFTVALTTRFGESDLVRAGADVVVDQFSEIQTLLREACG
jgi:beta-phosphoglucomutase-like phosphatase (HAD superfamily)